MTINLCECPSTTKKLVESLLGYVVMTDFATKKHVTLQGEMA